MKIRFVFLPILIFFTIMTSSTVFAHPFSIAFTKIELNHDQTIIQFAIDDLSILEAVEGTDLNEDYFLDKEEMEAKEVEILEWMDQHLILEINGKNMNLKEARLSLHEELPFKEQFQYQHELNYDEIMTPDSKIAVATLIYQTLNEGDTITLEDHFFINSVLTENYGNFLNIFYADQVQTTTVLFGDQRDYSFQLDQFNLDDSDKINDTNKSVVDWARFIWLGSDHILFGYDHLLFLFTLILLRMRFREYIKIITSFTLAHSITLGLAVTEIISISPKFIDTMIALSIIYVAVENIFFSKNAKHRWWITFIFGLIHGLGFAQLLIQMNLPKGQLVQSLLSFNIGIEITQILLVLLIFPLLYVWHRSRWYSKTFTIFNILGIGAGLVWLIQRLFEL
jgi:hypothetical protein